MIYCLRVCLRSLEKTFIYLTIDGVHEMHRSTKETAWPQQALASPRSSTLSRSQKAALQDKLPPVQDRDNIRFCRACKATLPVSAYHSGKQRYLCRRHTARLGVHQAAEQAAGDREPTEEVSADHLETLLDRRQKGLRAHPHCAAAAQECLGAVAARCGRCHAGFDCYDAADGCAAWF